MKKIIMSVVTCLLLSGLIVAQEKYPVPVRTGDQKHGRTLSQFYWGQSAAIIFAKEHGVSPYEFGKSMGKLAAQTWGPGNDFERLVKGVIYNWENFRHVSDTVLVIKENEDGSVIIISDEKMIKKYFPDDGSHVSYDEYKECFKGMFEPIADHMGATISMEYRDNLMITTITKK